MNEAIIEQFEDRWNWSAMKVLILGATGLVGGSALVQALMHEALTQVILHAKDLIRFEGRNEV